MIKIFQTKIIHRLPQTRQRRPRTPVTPVVAAFNRVPRAKHRPVLQLIPLPAALPTFPNVPMLPQPPPVAAPAPWIPYAVPSTSTATVPGVLPIRAAVPHGNMYLRPNVASRRGDFNYTVDSIMHPENHTCPRILYGIECELCGFREYLETIWRKNPNRRR